MKPLNIKFQGEYFSFSCFVYQVLCLTVCPCPNKAKDNFGSEMVF